MLEITVKDLNQNSVGVSQCNDRFEIAIFTRDGGLDSPIISLDFDQLATFAKELAGATALWGIIRATELQDAPTGGEVS